MTFALRLILLLCLLLVGATSLQGQELIPEAMTGNTLSDAERDALEVKLKTQPDDQNARLRLVGYYFSHRTPARVPHVLWVIKKQPASDLAGSPFCEFRKTLEPDAYVEGARLWQAHTAPDVVEPDVLLHAASYFNLEDAAANEQLLRRGVNAFPADTRFLIGLAQACALRRPAQHAQAFALFEQALTMTTDESERFYLLPDVAKAAVAAADLAKAKKYATELLTLAGRINDWNTGNAVHHGNLVLGRVALQEGNVELASAYLLKAGASKGSPQMDSFGPNMLLAKELLGRGQKAPVLAYLDLCSKFWKDKRLEEWEQEVQAGKVPDFEGNLDY